MLPEGWRSTLVVAFLAAVFNWAGWGVVKPNLDLSWKAGLADGFVHHLQWGPALDFTYGPYGYAGFLLPFYRSTALVAFLFILAVTWGLGLLVVGATRHYFGLLGAGLLAWLVLAITWAVGRAADFTSVLGLGLALCLLQQQSRARRTTLAVVLGAFAGFVMLVKLNAGVVLVALLVLASIGSSATGRERLRTAGAGLGCFVVAALASWTLAAQSFGNLVSFAHASLSLVLGYSTNMGVPSRSGRGAWWAAVFTLVLAALTVLGLRGRSRRAQWSAALMVAGWCWAVSKDGFVSPNHSAEFFRLLLMAVALMALLRMKRSHYVMGVGVATCITLIVTNVPSSLDPFPGASHFVADVKDLGSGRLFDAVQTRDRSHLAAAEAVGPKLSKLVAGHTLAVEPWEDLVAWATPDAHWDPEPIVQSYSAFTTYTDDLDATFLRSAVAPQRVLFAHRRFGFDHRDPYMEPPATMATLYCYYAQMAVEGHWQLLGRVGQRCGPASTVKRERVHFGQQVTVPLEPGRMVVASFSFRPTLLDRLETLALKPPGTHLEIWYQARRGLGLGLGKPVTYNFVTGTADDWHVLGTPPALGYAAAYTPGAVSELAVEGGGHANGQGWLTITFYAVPMKAARVATGGEH